MIFDMAAVQRIRDGRRTAVLRDQPLGQPRQPIQVRRYATDEDPAVDRERQARRADDPVLVDTLAWVNITGQEHRDLGTLTDEDVKQLGYPNLREFRRDHQDRRRAWFVTFELVRHETAPVRLVARHSGYTTNPALAIDTEAGEAVDRDTQQRFTDEARTADHLRHEKRRERYEQRMLEDRVRDLRLAHERGDLDASRILAGIERRVRAGESKRRAA